MVNYKQIQEGHSIDIATLQSMIKEAKQLNERQLTLNSNTFSIFTHEKFIDSQFQKIGSEKIKYCRMTHLHWRWVAPGDSPVATTLVQTNSGIISSNIYKQHNLSIIWQCE